MESELIKSAREHFTKQGQTVLFADVVEKYHDNKDGHVPRILVLTEHEITYFKGSTLAEFNRTFFLVDLIKIEHEKEKNKINMTFKPLPGTTKQRPCRFSTEKAGVYVRKIANHLVRILPPYLAISSGARALSDSGKENVAISALKRLDAYSMSRGIEIDPEIYKQVTDIVKYRQRKVVVPDLEGKEGSSSVVAASLQNNKYIEEIIFKPANGQGGFFACAKLPDGYSPFKHITFDQMYNKNLPQFFVTINDRSSNFNTDGFTLRNTQMTENNVLKIAQFFQKEEPIEAHENDESKTKIMKKKFESWCFDNAVLPEAYEAFEENLLTPHFLEHVKVLSINNLSKVNVESIVAKTPSAVALSFENNDLEISTVIRTILKQEIPTLKAISLAGNKCNEPTSTVDINISPAIELIDISNVTFADGQLVSFLRFILREKYTNGITISASGIKCSKEELVRGVEYIASVKNSPLVGLNWSNNSVPKQFSEIIKNATNLRAIYLNNCLTAEDKDVIQALAGALKGSKTLKKFMMTGGEKKVGTAIVPILKALKTIKCFEWLDVSQQGIGSEGLLAIGEIVDATKPKFINFDGSAAQSRDPIESIFSVAQNNGTPIVISYPVKDAEALSMDEAKLISSIATFSQEPCEVYDKEDPFTKAFDTYVHQSEFECEFPTFMSKKFVKDLEEATEIDYPQGELKSPKKSAIVEEEEDLEDDPERVMRQMERRNFYLDVSDVTTTDGGEISDEAKELKPMITEDGYVEPNWEGFPENILVPFDNTSAIAKNQKKYSLSVLREAIQ